MINDGEWLACAWKLLHSANVQTPKSLYLFSFWWNPLTQLQNSIINSRHCGCVRWYHKDMANVIYLFPVYGIDQVLNFRSMKRLNIYGSGLRRERSWMSRFIQFSQWWHSTCLDAQNFPFSFFSFSFTRLCECGCVPSSSIKPMKRGDMVCDKVMPFPWQTSTSNHRRRWARLHQTHLSSLHLSAQHSDVFKLGTRTEKKIQIRNVRVSETMRKKKSFFFVCLFSKTRNDTSKWIS